MEAPPLCAAPTTNTTAAIYPESTESSPRSRQTNSWDADPPRSQKLRLMCSYGGHIVPRPHDKALCYIGGDTRIILIDRHASLSDLCLRLSKTLLNNQPFLLKYQLPNEDLDSLISVATDEDLENMVEEFDRLNSASAAKPGRLRVFLFPKTSSGNIEQLLADTASIKSEDWFFNALNGKGSTLSASDRGFSESSSANNLLGLDDDLVGKTAVAKKDAEPQIEGSKSDGYGNTNINNAANTYKHDVNSSVPDSQILDTSSSFGSTSSSPSMANLPPIRVHVEENSKLGLGFEDHSQQMNLGVSGNLNLAASQKPPEVVTVVSGVPGSEYPNRVLSDDERSDQGGFRKAQQTQTQMQHQLPFPQLYQKPASTPFDLVSQDSVSSEGSITNPLSRQRQQAMYQESSFQLQSGNPRVAATDPKTQIQEPNYVLSGQFEQNHPPQQFIRAGNQYIPVTNQYIPTGAMPLNSYYPIYPSQQLNHPHQPIHDQQQPFYFVPARQQTHGYNIPMQQTNYNELPPPNVPSSQPSTYNQSKPEMSAGVYPTTAGLGPQYVGFTQTHHPSSNAYEFSDPNHTQMYYNQALPPQLSGHYQNQTPTTGPGVVASGQVPMENMKQQVRNLPP